MIVVSITTVFTITIIIIIHIISNNTIIIIVFVIISTMLSAIGFVIMSTIAFSFTNTRNFTHLICVHLCVCIAVSPVVDYRIHLRLKFNLPGIVSDIAVIEVCCTLRHIQLAAMGRDGVFVGLLI